MINKNFIITLFLCNCFIVNCVFSQSTIVPDQELPNKIPIMTSDNAPYGRAYASSVYSSYYPAWQAFDDTKRRSLWISKNNGTYTTQYLEYDFEEPITINAYNITPQTGNLTDRAPKNWNLQAWNGSYWKTIDTRSNMTESYWDAKASRNFPVNPAVRYTKYRLRITSTNGSPVVSLYDFKLFGPESISYKKSEKIESNLFDDNGSKFDFEIMPNPNNGQFHISTFVELYEPAMAIDDTSRVYILPRAGQHLTNNYSKVPVEIYNLQGILVYSSTINGNSDDIKLNLNKGIYLVVVNFESKKVTKKLIINK